MYLRDFLFRHAPTSGRMIGTFGRNPLTWEYYHWWVKSRDMLTSWHAQMMDAFWATEKQKLWHKRRRAQLDPAFNVGVRTRELVRAREAAREKGIYSGHPDYPVLSDIPDPGLKA